MKRLLVAAMLVLAGCGTGPAAGQGAHGYRLVVEKLGGTQVSIVTTSSATPITLPGGFLTADGSQLFSTGGQVFGGPAGPGGNTVINAYDARSGALARKLDVTGAWSWDGAGTSPDGRWLALTGPTGFVIVDTTSGKQYPVGVDSNFSFDAISNDGRRLYLIQAAEKGMAWLRLIARGTAGHGSMLQPDNAVTEVAEAVARVGRHEWPVRLTPAAQGFVEEAATAMGIEFSQSDYRDFLAKLGPLSRLIGATLTNTANPTMLSAGYKVNVVPQVATAQVDGRFLPGHEQEFFAELDGLLGPEVQREFVHHDVAVETTLDGELAAAMTAALLDQDPDGRVVPYCLSGGTDAKSFSRLGIRCFGFAPLRLPADLDFAGMFHGVDERVPVDALRFGVRVLDKFLDLC